MPKVEHAPQNTSMRETAGDPLSQNNPDNPKLSPDQNLIASADEKSSEEPSQNAHVQVSIRTRETRLYTCPNRGTDHYPSDLNRQIINNPALYMGSADF